MMIFFIFEEKFLVLILINLATLYRGVCTKTGKWGVMYSYVGVSILPLSTILIFGFGTVVTVWYIWFCNCCDSVVYLVLEMLWQWGIFGFGTVMIVWYLLLWNCCDSVVYLVLELLWQWGIFCFGTVATVGYILFCNCCDRGYILL